MWRAIGLGLLGGALISTRNKRRKEMKRVGQWTVSLGLIATGLGLFTVAAASCVAATFEIQKEGE